MRLLWVLSIFGALLILGWAALLLPVSFLLAGVALMAPGAALLAIELYERSKHS